MMVISKNRSLADPSQRNEPRQINQSELKEKEVSGYSGPPDISIEGYSP